MSILSLADAADGSALLTLLLERAGWDGHPAASVAEGRAARRERACQVLIATLSRYSAKRSRARAWRVGTCSLGTSAGR